MIKLKKIIDRIISDRKLDKNSIETTCIDKNKEIYSLEGINNENGDEEKYLIYNCSGEKSKFDFDYWSKAIEEESGIIPIIIFKDWDDEMGQYNDCQKNLKAADRKKLLIYFNNKLSYYSSMKDELKLYVENPENFVEYFPNCQDSHLQGYIYNLSLYELKKLFNITGRELFKINVRNGLSDDSTIRDIRMSFRNYLNVYVYKILIESKCLNQTLHFTLKEDLGIDDDMIDFKLPEHFWFCHNGITIFSYYSHDFDRSGNYITLKPEYISVINGAQTLTNFYKELENAKRDITQKLNVYQNDLKINEEEVSSYLIEAIKNTFVKTILIHGDKKYGKPITYGLNKQVPILKEHILEDSPEVYDLNLILKKGGIEILKEGASPIYGRGLDILEFVKKYLIVKGEPGKSKNLKKDAITEIVSAALSDFKEDGNFYLTAIPALLEIDDWWKKSKKERDDLYTKPNQKIINSYGKNYFESYFVQKNNKSLGLRNTDDSLLEIEYNEFLDAFENIKNLNLSDFKNDNLFNEINRNKNYGEIFNDEVDINYEDLKKFMNENIKSPYSMNKTILDYLKKKKNVIEYFRVITRVSGKCKECYPFPNSCFNELITGAEQNDYITFEDSKFKKEIEKEFPVFIIDKINKDTNEIQAVHLIKNFSFKEFEKDAKGVFEQTKEAFQKGDLLLFPKVTSNLKFHVRPKAIDGNDTFEFTNGEQITKQTFWANKDTVEKIINTLWTR